MSSIEAVECRVTGDSSLYLSCVCFGIFNHEVTYEYEINRSEMKVRHERKLSRVSPKSKIQVITNDETFPICRVFPFIERNVVSISKLFSNHENTYVRIKYYTMSVNLKLYFLAWIIFYSSNLSLCVHFPLIFIFCLTLQIYLYFKHSFLKCTVAVSTLLL